MANTHRRYNPEAVEVREIDGAAPVIAGYAAVFNQEAVIGGMFREVIRPGAFARMVENPPSELKALFNHDSNHVLGGISNSTLRISEDARGLRYEVDINTDDPMAMSVLAKVRRGDVDKSSFGFSVPEGGQSVERSGGTLPLRVVNEAYLYDVSPVAFPAYGGTSVGLRAQETASDEALALELVDPVADDDDWKWQLSLSRERCRLVEKA